MVVGFWGSARAEPNDAPKISEVEAKCLPVQKIKQNLVGQETVCWANYREHGRIKTAA